MLASTTHVLIGLAAPAMPENQIGGNRHRGERRHRADEPSD